MRIIHEIADIIVVLRLFPFYGWIALIGLLLFAGILFLVIRAGIPVDGGKRQWRNYIRSFAGKSRIAIVSVVAISAVAILFHFITSGSHGYCQQDGKYHTDEEFIKSALASDAKFLFRLDDSMVMDYALIDKLVNDYLSKNPDCCKVFREWDDELGDVSGMMWWGNVIVRVRNEESLDAFRNGTKRSFDIGRRYMLVGNCLDGAELIPEITPGG